MNKPTLTARLNALANQWFHSMRPTDNPQRSLVRLLLKARRVKA